VGKIAYVTLDEGFYVVRVPGVSFAWRTLLHYGIAAADDTPVSSLRASTMLEMPAHR